MVRLTQDWKVVKDKGQLEATLCSAILSQTPTRPVFLL